MSGSRRTSRLSPVARWIRNRTVGVQVGLVVGTVAAVASCLTYCCVAMAAHLARQHGWAEADVDDYIAALAWVLACVIGCVTLVALAGASILRGSFGSTIDELRDATSRVAAGCFEHRIGSQRCDAVGRLAGSIDAMAVRLQRLEAERRRMLASVSHELRTPLTVVRGHAFTLARTEADPVARARLDLIEEEVNKLDALIGDLLLAATLRATGVTLDLADTELVAVCTDTCERLAVAARERNVAIVVEAADASYLSAIDRRRIEQVLTNLVGNALRHAEAGSTVRLELSRIRAGCIRIAVVNRGAAIEHDMVERIFEPFVQGEHRAGNVGLGLFIAADLVAAHGSRLRVKSSQRTTRFWFDLTTVQSSEPAIISRPQASQTVAMQWA